MTHKIFILAIPGEAMADNTVNIGVNVSDNGSTSKVTKNVEVLRDLLVNTAAIAARINVGGGAMPFGGMGASTSTPRAARTPSAAPASAGVGGGAAPSGGTSGSRALSEQSRYGMFRGVAGDAGSAAGNFAEQAQGANSLVRLYATLAANVYAATAAFSALSKATDISNLTKGLDMVGAASGKNLGGLSQKLVEITEGALSLADSMKAVAKASSAGLSTENIERLGKVSKQSAQALGLDLGTAFDRLSRGVTKLEPELLDELGLFTKIGPATDEYARKMGKSASSLTDFEKRQAFANAVLDEGEKKFGAIALSSNGYNIILAKLVNGLQKVLEGINFVLKPIIDFLSASPTGLAIALGLVAKMILGSMLPALKDWRLSNKEAGEALKAQALVLAENKKQAFAYRTESMAGTAAKRLENAEIRDGLSLRKLSMDPSLSPKSRAALTSSVAATTDAAALKALEKRRDELQRDITARSGLQATAPALYSQKQTELKGFEEKIAAYKALGIAAKQYNDIEKVMGPPKPLSRKQEIAESKLLAEVQRNSIVQRGLEVQALDGTRAGFRALWQEMALARKGRDTDGILYADGTKRLQGFAWAATGAAGSIKLLGTALATVGSTLMGALGWISLLVGGMALLKDIFGTAKKETVAFSESSDTLNSAVKNVGATLDNISTKKFLDVTTVQQAANAFNDLNVAVTKNVKAFDMWRGAPKSFLENVWEGALSVVNKDTKSELAKSLSNTVIGALSLMEEGPAKDKFKKSVTTLLPNVDPSSFKSLNDAFKGLTDSGIVVLFNELTPALKAANLEMAQQAANLTALKSGFTETSKLVNDLNNNLKLTDEQGKLGTQMLEDASKLGKALSNPKDAIIALKMVTDDFNLMSLFPPETQKDLVAYKSVIDKISESLKTAREDKIKLTTQLSQEKDKGTLDSSAIVSVLTAKLVDANKRVYDAEIQSSLVSDKFKKLSGEVFVQAFKKIEISLKNAMQEAGIIAARGYLGIIKATGGSTAIQEGALKIKELETQRDVIKANHEHTISVQSLRLSTDALTAATNVKIAQDADIAAKVALSTGSGGAAQVAKEKAKTDLADVAAFQSRKSNDNATRPGQELVNAERATLQGADKTKIISDADAITSIQDRLKPIAAATILTLKQQSDASALVLKNALTSQAIADGAVKLNAGKYKDIQAASDKAAKPLGKNATEDEKAAKEIERGIASAVSPALVAGTALQGQMAKVAASISAVKLDTIAANEKEIADQALKVQDNILLSKNATLDQVKAQQQYLGIFDATLDAKQAGLELDIQAAEKEKEKIGFASIVKMIEAAQLQLIRERGETEAQKTKQYISLENNRALVAQASGAKAFAREIEIGKVTTTSLIRKLTGEEALATITRERAAKTLEFENNIKQTVVANLEAQLGMRQALGIVSDKEMAIRTAELSISKQAIDYSQQKLAVENTIAATVAKSAIDKAGFKVSVEADKTLTPEERTAKLTTFDENAKKNLDTLNLQKSSIDAQNASKLYGIEISKQTQLQLAAEKKILEDQALAMDKLTSLANDLGIVFGDVGKNFGAAMTGILKATQDNTNQKLAIDKQYAKDSTDLQTSKAEELLNLDKDGASSKEDTIQNTLDIEAKYAKKGAALVNKQNRDKEISNMNMYGSEIGAMKSMFDKKTAAYKIFNVVEKGIHLVSMAMKIQGMIMDATATTSSVANSGVRGAASVVEAGISGVKAVVNTIAAYPPPFNYIAAAATAAVIASLLSSIGGSGPSVPSAGSSAEEQQKVQGTGQRYVNGKLVDTGGGAFGDITDKSKSVENSIALMEDHAFKNLDYSNKMLDQLKKIQENTNDFAKTLITIGGFTTAAPTVSGGNWLSGKTSTQTLDKGLMVIGTIGQAKSGTADVGQFENTMTSDSGWLGFIGGGNTPGSSFTKLEERDQKRLVEGMQNMFVGASDALVAAGAELGKTGVEAIIDGVDLTDTFKVSTLGLKGQELAEAIASSISNEMDIAAEKAFPELMSFRNIGEHMAETVTRVVDTTRKVNFAFDSIGKSTAEFITTFTTDTNFFGLFKSTTSTTTKLDKLSKETADAMAKLAGGLIPLLDEIAAYSDNFLTEAEKLAPTQSAVTKQMAFLGFSSITTKDQFKALVNSIDVTTDTGRKLFQNLMEVQDGFNQVAQSEEKLADSRDSQTDTIRKLIGTEKTLAASLKASRDKELKAMDPSLVATQKYINALTDEVAARDKAATAVKSTIDSLKGSVKTLTDYQTSLATGAQGTMTPEQRYAALQQELLSTQTAAMGPTDTPAQLVAQQAAAAKLPQAASAFLDASKVLNASSSKYSDDLKFVQDKIKDTITSVTGTQSLAEKNLTALGPLVSIDASTKSTAELMLAFVTAQGLTETARLAMNIATDKWQRDLLAKLNPVNELVGPLQPTEAVRLAADAAAAKTAADAAKTNLLIDNTEKIAVVNDSLVLSVGALDDSTAVLTTAVEVFGLGADTNTASVLTAVNSNLNASTVLDTSMGSLNTNVNDLNFNMSDNTASLGYLGSPAFAAFLAKAIGDAIDTGSIVTAINDSSGAIIKANATVVDNQTVELTNNATDNIETTKYNGRNYKLYQNQMED